MPDNIKEPTQPNTETTGYELMDAMDEAQIVNELEGRFNPKGAQKQLVYAFKDKSGREQTGLSWYGTKAVWWKFNKEESTDMTVTDKVIVTQGDGYVDVAVYAFDKKRGIGAWGMARGYTQFRKRNNQVQSDPFASAKAMSKAQRNALNNLFDSNLVAKIVKEWIKRGHVTQLKQPSAKDQLKVTEDEQKNIDPWVNKIKMVKTRKDYDNVIKAAMTANLTGKEIAFIRKAYEQHHGKPTP